MKKFTLLLMSLFLTLGTAVAQDDAFALQSMTPSSDQPVSDVSYVQFEFNKDVTVTLPEGGLEIKKNGTEEVYRLTRLFENPYMPKNIVQLMFEQESIIGKDGKEELVDKYINTPGEYTLTIPAGVIQSTDGDAFGEYTATFTVFEELKIADVTPTRTANLETIQVTFDKPVAEVNMPEGGMTIVDDYWTPVANIENATISDDKMTVTLKLATPVTTVGWYCIEYPAGMFVSEDGAMNAQGSSWIEVYDPTPSYSFNYENGAQVQAINNLEITFKNVNKIKLGENAGNVVVYMPGYGSEEGVATVEGNKIIVKFSEMTADGDYTFVIPAGFFTMDGTANEICEIKVTLATFKLTSLEVVNVDPAQGTVGQLDRIIVTYNQPVRLAWNDDWTKQISQEIKMTCGDKEYTLTINSSYSSSNNVEYLVNAEWTGYEYKSTPITAEGTYTINLADIVVDYGAESYVDEWDYPNTRYHGKGNCEGTCSWTIGDTAIDEVEGENGEVKTIYDLTGRRVESITAPGIYVVNGKKVLVK